MDGVIVVDKPAGWTSHDVVNRMRRLANTKKVGHLGTLDPMATGVLPVVIGKATRLQQFFVRNEKVYEGVIRFGFATDSYDRDGTPTTPERTDFVPTVIGLEPLLDAFRGTFDQTPPPVSAKKVGGKKAYEFARQNIAVELKPVTVTVSALDLLSVDGQRARIRMACSAGTYVRSVAHELGIAAGCGAHLDDLRRIQSGDFNIDQARTLEQLEADLASALIPAANLLPDFATEIVDATTVGMIRQGREFRVSPFRVRDIAQNLKAVSETGELVAIAKASAPNLYHPFLVL
ncbi:tRNA pseudouridine synthase B [Bryobacterales bacterium F-183]|nr:tRNA pseudouridine synthase B [Bryobacterales bacterium F-183]